MKKGFLFVIEGIDGAGKSTQARSLLRKLRNRGIDAVAFREPTGGRWGRELKRKAKTAGSLTPEEELALFLKDRRENVSRNLKPALGAGRVVVLDRYYYSTIAYQGAKGLNPERIRRLNERFAPTPDLVFLLDVPPGDGLARIAGRPTKDALFERASYLRRVRAIFRRFRGPRFVHLDARAERGEIGREILRRTLAVLGRSGGRD
jgi:dTMP kinase